MEELNAEKQRSVLQQRKGFIRAENAKGPDAVIVPLWMAVVIFVGSSDGVCDSFEGHTSGMTPGTAGNHLVPCDPENRRFLGNEMMF